MVYQRSQDVIARREGDKALAFHQQTGWICILNPSSRFIWDCLESAMSAEAITDRIRTQFTVPPEADGEVLLITVKAHLDLMCKAQLIETVEGPLAPTDLSEKAVPDHAKASTSLCA
jgi:hypothetical protein